MEIKWLLTEKYQGVESETFYEDCAQLEAGVPLGYLIGHVPFLDCTIYLDSHPLIPRPETEYWVEQAIHSIKSSSTRLNLVLDSEVPGETSNLPINNLEVRGRTPYFQVLDLCAGSGAIGVAIAKAVPEAKVTFTELDPTHLLTIEKNLAQNTIIYDCEKYKVLSGDLFSALPNGERYDFILTNPPYINAEANTVEKNVVDHEPHLALFGGEAGMELIAKIIFQAPQYLLPRGQLWVEHEPAQVEAITALAHTHNFTIITHPDQYGVPRFSVLTMAQ